MAGYLTPALPHCPENNNNSNSSNNNNNNSSNSNNNSENNSKPRNLKSELRGEVMEKVRLKKIT